MNLKDAYSILELDPGTSPEEAKKRYRELTKKYHPDVNKEAGAEDKFKKINEAYTVVSTGKSTDREDMHWNRAPQGHANPFDPFGRQGRQVNIVATHIELHTTLSFKESVLGVRRELKFNRSGKCQTCEGQGSSLIDNGCKQCGGRGQVTTRRGNMIFTQTCDKCYGRVNVEPCKTCASTGVIDTEVSVNVNIPGGVVDGNVLRLSGMGNFAGGFMGMDQYTDAHLHIKVTPEAGFSLEGTNVVSTLEVSLLEALRGCSKKVKTVLGDREVDVKPMSRNKDEIIISRVGVNRVGNQKVILDVKYPKDINNLIGVLDDSRVT
jgi:molecular chaperone DnaJ